MWVTANRKTGTFFVCVWTFGSAWLLLFERTDFFFDFFFFAGGKNVCTFATSDVKNRSPLLPHRQQCSFLSASRCFFFFFLPFIVYRSKNWHSCNIKTFLNGSFFPSLDPWKDVINNKVPQERAMINFSFWLAMAWTPPRCLRETAPAFLFLHLLSFLDPSQHNRALWCLSASAVMACVNTLYMNKKRVCVWFRFTRGPSSGRIQNREVFDRSVATIAAERPS